MIKKNEKIEKLSERTPRAPSLARRGQYELRFKTEQAKLSQKNKQLIAQQQKQKKTTKLKPKTKQGKHINQFHCCF